jgi:hypothetical protein
MFGLFIEFSEVHRGISQSPDACVDAGMFCSGLQIFCKDSPLFNVNFANGLQLQQSS